MIVNMLGLIDMTAAVMLFYTDFGSADTLKVLIIMAIMAKGMISLFTWER